MHREYTAKDYSPDKVNNRYVKLDMDGRFIGIEVGVDRRFNLRLWYLTPVEIDSLTPEQVVLCGERKGMAFSYVDWPM